MEPKPIEPQDIRVGDRVRCEERLGDDVRTVEFTIADRDGDLLFSTRARYSLGGDDSRTWTLLNRRIPNRPVGSHWLDPETGAEYVATDTPGVVAFYRYRRADDAPRQLNDEYIDAAIIARLVPVGPDDLKVLWPATRVAPFCFEQEGGWRCCRAKGHPGVHAAYTDEDRPPAFVWGDPR